MTRIAAGIVLYNPDIDRLSQNIHAIWNQVDKVYLVDNASSNLVEIEKLINEFSNISVLKNTENFGIAKALNQICGMAARDGNDWILTLDQDTICPSDIIVKFLPFISLSNIGILCPQFKVETQNLKMVDPEKVLTERVELCITSASLNRLDVWRSIGGFLNWLFIDCVDYDYCIRVRKKGYSILRINDVIINHIVGDPDIINLPLGVSIPIYNHSSFRNYYIVRNNIYLLRSYWKEIHGFIWLMKFAHFELVKLIFEKKKLLTLRSFLRGLKDGLTSKLVSIQSEMEMGNDTKKN